MNTPPLVPRRLRPHDLIGLVAPASPVLDSTRIDAAARYFEAHGYRVRLGAHAGCINGYLAGSDQERVEDLHAMVRDPEVAAIVCLRGGYGVTRLLPLLEYPLFAQYPKIVCGFSDITALQAALWTRCRLVTFHGPMAAVDFSRTVDPFTEKSFWETVAGDAPPAIVQLTTEASGTLVPGKARGWTVGGNLSLLAALAGTPYLPSMRGAILFIEEVGEEPYRIDRMLVQLRQSGVLDGIAGVVAGGFTDCLPRDPVPPTFQVPDLLAALAQELKVPFLTGAAFGHVPAKLTIPFGVEGELDADRGRFSSLHNPVF